VLLEGAATTRNLTEHVARLWRDLNFILAAERDLAAPLTVPAAARVLLDPILATAGAHRGSIYEARGSMLEPVASHGVPERFLVPVAIEDPTSIAAWVYRHGAPLLLNDTSRLPPALHAHHFPLPAGDHDAFLALPLLFPDAERTPVGVLQMAGKSHGHFSADEVKLATAAAQMAAVAIQRSRSATEALAASRLREELRIAAEINSELLPRSIPSLPGLKIAALTRPAAALSGDYYDFVVGQDWLDFLVADVQGHGLGAALLVATVRAAVRPALRAGHSPGAALQRLNHVLLEAAGESGIFVTAAVARLRGDRVTLASAGHPPLLLAGDGPPRALDGSGPPAGAVPEARYPESEAVIGRHGTLALTSDGVLGGGGQGTVDRLLETLAAEAGNHPAAIAEALVVALEGPEDDRTVVVVQRDGG
jgi:serine phosphatase RsbU (regulator of sigma subunit)